MQKKKIMALLMATTVITTSPAFLANPMVVCAEESESVEEASESDIETQADQSSNENDSSTNTIENNTEKIENNTGIVEKNSGEIVSNSGTVKENDGKGINNNFEQQKADSNDEKFTAANGNGIKINSGEVDKNNGDILKNENLVKENAGTIQINHGTIKENDAFIIKNENDGIVENNKADINRNYGTVKENNGYIDYNYKYSIDYNYKDGIIEVNNSEVFNNYGTVKDNKGYVAENREGATVNITKDDKEKKGFVGENYGTVNISVAPELTAEEVEAISKDTIRWNLGKIILGDGTNTTKFLGVRGYNGLVGKDYFNISLGSIKEGEKFILNVPSGFGVDGVIKLDKNSTSLEVIDTELETDETGNYYIVPIGTQFIVKDVAEFRGMFYKIVVKNDGTVTAEVVEDIKPIEKATPSNTFASSIPGVNINNWNDVSKVFETKASSITPEPNSDIKLLKLELNQNNRAVPANVVASLAKSSVDGLHCFIGGGNAITFVNNGTLDNYIPTDFTMNATESATMKVIDFAKPQEIGATVMFSTRVPAKNAPVAVWMEVDGKQVLVGTFASNETGNIAFPISSTAKYTLTY